MQYRGLGEISVDDVEQYCERIFELSHWDGAQPGGGFRHWR